jgi:hypothetical protein
MTRVVAVALLLSGCAASEVSLYAADMQACVETAKSRADADACRANVKARWHDRWRAEFPDAGF